MIYFYYLCIFLSDVGQVSVENIKECSDIEQEAGANEQGVGIIKNVPESNGTEEVDDI